MGIASAGEELCSKLVVNGQVFWGEDSTVRFEEHMLDTDLFDSPEMSRLTDLPIAAARPGAK